MARNRSQTWVLELTEVEVLVGTARRPQYVYEIKSPGGGTPHLGKEQPFGLASPATLQRAGLQAEAFPVFETIRLATPIKGKLQVVSDCSNQD
jgi:hypothetical protein